MSMFMAAQTEAPEEGISEQVKSIYKGDLCQEPRNLWKWSYFLDPLFVAY